MRRVLPSAVVATVAGASLVALSIPAASVSAAGTTPRWVTHVQHYSGGISAGVRASLDPGLAAARSSAARRSATLSPAPVTAGPNVVMNDDSYPKMPQNETAVATSPVDPMVAVAAANDYVSGGVVVMRTSDGGRHWASTRVTPEFRPTGDLCNGGDPSLAYSQRDGVFYLSQLCFFRELAHSEVQVFVSRDNGATWTPGRQTAKAASTYDYATRTEDTTNFLDRETLTVDNTPGSPHYGRLYVVYTKFHLLASGLSDYCPLQLSYTDNVPAFNPALTTFVHSPVVPDSPGADGKNASANQAGQPIVETNGALDVSYLQEDCNSGADFHLLFQKSTDGGDHFLAHAVTVDKPGQFADNPDLGDNLAPTHFRAPESAQTAYSRTTGTLTYLIANSIHKATDGTDISYWQSHDGGKTWGAVHALSAQGSVAPGPAAHNDQFMPAITATPSGKLYAIWFDRRRDPANHDIETWQAESVDDGAHWTTGRISTAPWNPDHGFFSSGAFIGDYNAIAANDHVVYPVWTDGRNTAYAATGIGETDIFTNVEIH